MLQLKIPQASTKTLCSQAEKLGFWCPERQRDSIVVKIPRPPPCRPSVSFPASCILPIHLLLATSGAPYTWLCLQALRKIRGGGSDRSYAQLGSCLVLSNSLHPHGLWPTRLLCPWDYPSKNTGVGCHALLQRIFPTQGLNPGLLRPLNCRQILYHWATGEAW